MRVEAELLPEAPMVERRAVRHALPCEAKDRERGKTGLSVHILHISTSGCRIETGYDLPLRAYVWLKMPGLESWTAHITWCRRRFAGCNFERTLHPAIVERLTAR